MAGRRTTTHRAGSSTRRSRSRRPGCSSTGRTTSRSRPPMDSEAIARLLPGVFQTALHPVAAGVVEPDRRLAALLDVMEAPHAPVESVLGGLDHYLDPRLATPAFVPYLAGWVDLDWLLVADPSAHMA